MNIDGIATKFVAGVIAIATLTTIFGRSNAPRVIDSIGKASANLIDSALGANANLR